MSNKLFYPICLALVLALAGFAQAELLTNRGFEADLEPWGTWGSGSGSGSGGYLWSGDYHTTILEDGTAHSGNKYVEVGMWIPPENTEWWGWGYVSFWQDVPVTAGNTYQISAWVRDGNADGASSLIEDGAWIVWEWRSDLERTGLDVNGDGQFNNDDKVFYNFDITEEWSQISTTEVAPPGAMGLSAVLGTGMMRVNVDIDDASCVELVTIAVPDAGFDDTVLSAGGYMYVGEGAWDGELDYPGPWQSAGGDAWIDNAYYDGDLLAVSGDNKLYGNDGVEDYVYQILDETFIAGATYTLSVWTGSAWSDYADGWWLYFTGEDYNNNLAETSGNGPVGSWEQMSLVYTATAADAGNKIGIKMKGDNYVTFDEVTLLYYVPPALLTNGDFEADLALVPNPGDTDANAPTGWEYDRYYGYDVDPWLMNVSAIGDGSGGNVGVVFGTFNADGAWKPVVTTYPESAVEAGQYTLEVTTVSTGGVGEGWLDVQLGWLENPADPWANYDEYVREWTDVSLFGDGVWTTLTWEFEIPADDPGIGMSWYLWLVGESYDDYVIVGDVKLTAAEPGVTIPVDPNSDLAAANELAQPGDTIEFAEGTYYLTSQIEIKDGVTYKGAGPGLTIIDGNDVTRAFVAWGDRGATNGQVDVNGVSVPNLTGPTDWVLDGLTIQNCVSDANNRQDILSSSRDLLNNYEPNTPYTLATAQAENGGVTDNPEWFDILSGSADPNLTDVELQAYLDGNPVGSAGHLVVNDDKSEHGAALIMRNGAQGTIQNCTVSNNSANFGSGDGGAINVDGGGPLALTIENCAFNRNTCVDYGGALRLSGNASIYTIMDTTFTENYCGNDGGAIRADGDDSIYVLTDCTFIGNYAADDGAAVRYGTDRAELTVTNCAFIGNGKDPNGTVVTDDSVWSTHDDDAGPMTFINCLFADNACKDDRLIELKAAFALLNCTFIGNVAGDKPLIAVRGRPWDSTGDGVDDVITDDSIISNCLFINNTMLSDSYVIGDIRDNVFAPTVTNCLFFGNLDGENPAINTDDATTEVGTIDVSAVTDAAQIVVDPAGDYHPVAGSPAIDASDPATATASDIEGTAAVGVRDVGAYEASGN